MNESVPAGWDRCYLGDICQFKGGNGFPEKFQRNASGDYPFIKVSDMNLAGNERNIFYAINWIDKETKDKLNIKLFPKKTIVFAKVGAALLLNRRRILIRETAIDNNMMGAISLDNGGSLFLYYLLLDIDFKDFVQEGAIPSINQSQLSEIQAIFPPLPEQQKITSILTSVDTVIEKTETQINKLKDLKKAMMQELLTKGIGHTEFKDSPVGRVPKGWEIYDLKSMTKRILVGLATSVTKYYRDSGIPIIRNLNIKKGYFDGSKMLYLDSTFSSQNKNKTVKENDVITVHTGSNIGLTCLVPREYDGAQTFTTLIITTKQNLLYPQYLVNHMNSDLGISEIDKLQVGGGKNNLNVGDLINYQIVIPPELEQRQIANITSSIDAKISSANIKLSHTKSLKKALMQDLLTGKVRVAV